MSLSINSGEVGVYLGFGRKPILERRPDPASPDNPDLFILVEVDTTPKFIRYLGTGVVGVETEIRSEWEPIKSDSAGNVPDDMAFAGEQAYIHLELSRWNEATLQEAQSRPYTSSTISGSVGKRDIGRLLIRERLGLTLYLAYRRRNTPSMIEGQMGAGWRFPFNTYMLGPDIRKVGTRMNSVSLLFHAIPFYSSKYRQRVLYDQDISALIGRRIPNAPPV